MENSNNIILKVKVSDRFGIADGVLFVSIKQINTFTYFLTAFFGGDQVSESLVHNIQLSGMQTIMTR